METEGLLVLSRTEVARLLDFDSCIAAVERAFRLHGEGKAAPPVVCGVRVPGGGFHVKAGALEADAEAGGTRGDDAHAGGGTRAFFAAKTNANFTGNPSLGLPAVQGVVVLFDAERGVPLAVLDSAELTTRRTAAATAVAARHLARRDASTLAIIGCGVQGMAHARALARVLPLEEVLAFDSDPAAAARLAVMAQEELGLRVSVASDPAAAARRSDACVMCTPSCSYLLGPDDVPRGCFVAGVGADSEEKRELAPELLARGRVVADLTAQCARIGDLHHALDAGALTIAGVHAELGEVVAGRRPGRTDGDGITIFDSTGMALQDVAAAALVLGRAWERGAGVRVSLGGSGAGNP